ncbi:MAG: XRE family transcriptional regulator [Citromicrobium sp.]|nr:MAG: XRE family transcriptional regulator [Citromicrobium sp.]
MVIRAHLDQADQRQGVRRQLRLATSGALPSGEAANVLIHNASATGLLMQTPAPLSQGETIELVLPEAGVVAAEIVWQSGEFYGCQFAQPLREAVLSAAELRSAPPVTEALPPAGTLGERLHRLRLVSGMTLDEVAQRLSVSKPTVWAWEHDKARPVAQRFDEIAALFGVDASLLTESARADPAAEIIGRARRMVAEALGISGERVRIMLEY